MTKGGTFWDAIGRTFPSLKGATSTRYSFECERWLFETFCPSLNGRSVFKTDLWDEAKKTEILRWAAARGARPFGIDIAFEIAREARAVLATYGPGLAVSDVRALPFRTDAFELIYSMGTIEHFPDVEVAAREIFRVLKPGGTAIIGVPNKFDPFSVRSSSTCSTGWASTPMGWRNRSLRVVCGDSWSRAGSGSRGRRAFSSCPDGCGC